MSEVNKVNQKPIPKSNPRPSSSPKPGQRETFNTPERRSIDRNTSLEIKPPRK